MSLFEGVFSCGQSKKKSSLFKEDSKYKRSQSQLGGEECLLEKEGRKRLKKVRRNEVEAGGEELDVKEYGHAATQHQGLEEKGDERFGEGNASDSIHAGGDQSIGDTSMGQQGGKLSKSEMEKRETIETEKLERTIFVGNLVNGRKLRKKLKVLFSQFGPVESTRIRSVGVTEGSKIPKRAACAQGASEGQGSCNGYVVFQDKASVKAALKMNMTLFEGQHLRVDRSTPQRQKPTLAKGMVFDERMSVFIHNLVPEVSDEDIIQFLVNNKGVLQVKGRVEAVRIIRDPRQRLCKGIGFVKFNSRRAVAAALEMDGTEFMGRKLKVNKVKKMKSLKGVDLESTNWERTWSQKSAIPFQSKSGGQGKGGAKRKQKP